VIRPVDSVIATPPVLASVERSSFNQPGVQPRGKRRSLITMSAALQASISAG